MDIDTPESEPTSCPAATPMRVVAPTASFRLPDLDLVITWDVTGSMGRQVEALKTEVGQLSTLRSRPAEPKARLEMALLLEADGDIEDALEHLGHGLAAWESADEAFEPAREARERLGELQRRS